MKANDRQAIGQQGLTVSQFSVDGTGFGNLFRAMDQQTAGDIVAAAFAAGVRYFDTAPLYGFGLSETRLGAGLAPFPRDQLVISTKVGYTLTPSEKEEEGDALALFVDVPATDTSFNFSRDAVMRGMEESLQRLQTDYVDILLIHDPDEGVTLFERELDPYARSHFEQVMEETYPALDQLRSEGTIRALGLGMNQWGMLADFARAGDFDCFLLAGRYTLLEQEPLAEFLPLCQQKGIRIVIGGPFNSGILALGAVAEATYDYAPPPPEILERVRQIQAVCAAHGVSLPAAALQFPFGHPAVASIIPGASSVAQVTANIGYFEEEIPGSFWQQLKEQELIDSGSPLPR